MPCYNAEVTVTRAIRSIQGQTIQNWELIIVDDGSTDNTANIVADLAETDDRIQLVKREHEGVVAASNYGFTLATASLIARMDADDVSRPDRLEKQRRRLIDHPELGAVSCLAHFAGNVETAGGYAHHVGVVGDNHPIQWPCQLDRYA